jgi:micrococcal nuclease
MYKYKAELLRWIDGDTILVRIDLGFHCERQERIRLAKINSWELNSSSSYRRRGARSVKAKAKRLCPHGSKIIIQTKKNPVQDMYARYIANVLFNGIDLSNELVKLKGVEKYK